MADALPPSLILAQQQGDRLKHLRQDVTRLSRRAFASKHGISLGTLQNWEDGRYNRGISHQAAAKLLIAFQAEGIDVTLDWLLYGEGCVPVHRFQHIQKIISPSATDSENAQLDDISLIQKTVENEKRHKLNLALFNAAADGRYKEVVRLVNTGIDAYLYEGFKVKSYEQEHNTPLHLAALNGYLDIVKYLLKKKADINVRNRKLQTPLHLAVHNAHKNIIEYLVQHNADINAVEDEADTPLAWAAYKGQTEIVSLLLKLGANIHSQNNAGNTPLHWAAEKGYLDIVELLIAHNANLNIKNVENQTPLMLAVENGHLDTVQLLLEKQKIK